MSYRLVPAEGALLDQILRESHSLWSEGLSPAAYARYNHAQMRTPWGAAHLGRVALVRDETLIASAKRYDLSARLDGRIRRVLGIGAVFTALDQRGRGGASALMEQLLENAVAEGYEFALLFSEIGPRFYERFNFVPLPLTKSTLRVKGPSGTPAVLLRAGDDRDIPLVAEMSAGRSREARFALDRSEDLVRFAIAKKRLLAGLGPDGLRQVEFQVTEEGLMAVAYLVCSHHEGRWTIEECGDRDPTGARVGAMLQSMLAREPSHAPPVIDAWWPEGWVPPQLEIVDTRAVSEVMMLRPLQDRTLPLPPLDASQIVFWHADAF
jgi:predicted N-acetyltransferase YhbS